MARARSDLKRFLAELVDDPREAMAVEIKDWLDLTQRDVAANLVRELLALANNGGGTLLFGFADRPAGIEPSEPCPYPDIDYSQDSINNLCKRYADPPFHCSVHRMTSSIGNEHIVIEVPGGHRVPVRARRAGPEGSKLKANVYYVRRPGPESAPIGSAQEWDTLLRRCLSAQRDDLLESFRAIVSAMGGGDDVLGLIEAVPEKPTIAWREESEARLAELIADELADEDPSRYALGTFSATYRVLDPGADLALHDLLAVLNEVQGRETGWPPWGVFQRDPLRPVAIGQVIECWLRDTMFKDGAHSDFWRVSVDGKAFLLRGFQEDTVPDRLDPGTALDLTLPVWRTGECLLHAGRLGARLGGTRVEFQMRWTGLRGRKLATFASTNRLLPGTYVSRQDEVLTTIEADVATIADTLPELVRHLVEPMYASFSFFQPPDLLYAQELTAMRDRA
jgi:hypothetical protein